MATDGASNADDVLVLLNSETTMTVDILAPGTSEQIPAYHDPDTSSVTANTDGTYTAICGTFTINLDTQERAESWVAAKAVAHWLDLPFTNGVASPPQQRAMNLADAFEALPVPEEPQDFAGSVALNGEGTS